MVKVYLDTNYFIYFLENRTPFAAKAAPYFKKAASNQLEIIASPFILQEILTGIYKFAEDESNEIYALLVSYPNLNWAAYSIEVADLAARVSADFSIKAPDAIHLATAMHYGASSFLTMDKKLAKIAKNCI